uniref:Uncharacterized protein n=1 Tax=Plectus sambesii TaxID=2011161 RepID=A0A914XN33_9BILA
MRQSPDFCHTLGLSLSLFSVGQRRRTCDWIIPQVECSGLSQGGAVGVGVAEKTAQARPRWHGPDPLYTGGFAAITSLYGSTIIDRDVHDARFLPARSRLYVSLYTGRFSSHPPPSYVFSSRTLENMPSHRLPATLIARNENEITFLCANKGARHFFACRCRL